jgi:23S rRNA pseudouridine1911/1915/1917 synthase
MTQAEVSAELDGRPLGAVVRTLFQMTWSKARDAIASGKVKLDGEQARDERMTCKRGAVVSLEMNTPRVNKQEDAPKIVYVDEDVVVVDKPAGLMTVAFEKEHDTLIDRVRHALRLKQPGSRPELGLVHRIDKETSGLIVFARGFDAKRELGAQFQGHSVERRYLALVHGEVGAQMFSSRLVEDRGDGLRGSTRDPRKGLRAVTHVTPVRALRGATLLMCRLETGRTHQIRIHLSEAGHPLVGERVYIRDFTGTRLPAPRLMLHATELGFVHPRSKKPVHWQLPLPPDMEQLVQQRLTV